MKKSTICIALAMGMMAGVACSADNALPAWPAPGSRFPASSNPPRAAAAAERTGDAVWAKPPAVLSPYDASWYDYMTIVWGSDKRLKNNPVYFQMLKKMYVRGAMVYGQDEPAPTVAAGMPFYNTCICNQLYIRNKTGPALRDAYKKSRIRANCVRKPSLESPATDAAERRSAASAARRCGPYKSLGYDLRDEATYVASSACPHDFDFSDVSLAGFRQWLKTKYGALEVLNKQWDTSFAAWENVFPMMTDEIQAREFKKMATLNLSPWSDHREYNDDTFAAAIVRYSEEILRNDAGAPTGISGTQMPAAYGGFDFWKLCAVCSWIEHYDVCGSRELMRSFMPPRTPLLAASRYQSGVQEGLVAMWYLALHGDGGGLVWPYAGHGDKVLMLDVNGANVSLTAVGRTLRDIFREARGGIPCLIRHADQQTEPVAVLYSQSSLRADWMLEVKRDGKHWMNRSSSFEGEINFAAAGRVGLFKLLEDCGIQYVCLSSQQVEGGELSRRGIRLLFAPRSLALSAAEIGAMKEFVTAGGVLVTDIMAGRMDQNGRVWPGGAGPMDALLGVARAPFSFEEETKAEAKGSGYAGGFGRPLDVTMAADFGSLKAGAAFRVQGYQEPGLKAGAGKALASTPSGPALISQIVGKGAVFTLNFDIPNYPALRGAKDADAMTAPYRALCRALLEKAGVRPAVKVALKSNGQHPPGLETFVFVQGKARYVAVIRNDVTRINWEDLSDSGQHAAEAGGSALSLDLGTAGYVTEMRTGHSFGLTSRVETTMPTGAPLLLSVLPYEVRELAVDAGTRKIADGRLALSVAIKTPAGEAGDHVVHAELRDARGEPIPESVVNIPLPGGRYAGALDLSQVKEPGPFELHLRDAASGRAVSLPISR